MYSVERFIDVEADLEAVWKLISTQEGMRKWISSGIQIDVRIGGGFRIIEQESGQLIRGEVLQIVERKSITLSWFEDGSDWLEPTEVTFRLEELQGRIRVHVCHSGFERIREQGWERTVEAYRQGWARHQLLENLKAAAEARAVGRMGD